MQEKKIELVEPAATHSRAAKLWHWGFTVLFLFALTKQLDEVDELEDFSLLQYEMAFAGLFLLVMLIRFIYMQRSQPTVMPTETPKHIRQIARAVHLGMYAGVALIAVTGLWIGGLYWSGTKSGATMDVALLAHEIAVNTSYCLILGHIVAALVHRRKADGIWESMVPIWHKRNAE